MNDKYCIVSYRQLRENIIHSQPLEKKQSMAQLFDMLMDGIERNLLSRNRDRWVALIYCIVIIKLFYNIILRIADSHRIYHCSVVTLMTL